MQTGFALRRVTSTAGLLLFCALATQADIVVTDNGLGFSPDPANIDAGQAVFWQDDGSGPYEIVSDTGAWAPFFTPGGVQFSAAGSYPYHDDAGNFGTVQVVAITPTPITLSSPRMVAGQFQFDAAGLAVGKTNVLQSSTNLLLPGSWVAIATNVATSDSMTFTNATLSGAHFFRLVQLP
jgi:plastocyanin